MYFGVKIYRLTFIDWRIPTIIAIIVGLVVSYFDFKKFKKTLNYGGISLYVFLIIQSFASWGFIISSVFLFSNYYFADSKKEMKTFEIIEADWIRGNSRKLRVRNKKQPTFDIEHNGKIKELVFYADFYTKRNDYHSVELLMQNGFFGYEIIKEKKLNE